MDAAALRELQAPLKTKYRDSPEAALVTLQAEGDLDAEGIACKVDTGRLLVEAGLHAVGSARGLHRGHPEGGRDRAYRRHGSR